MLVILETNGGKVNRKRIMVTMRSAHGTDSLRGIPMEALRAFDASARHLNFTHAAHEMHLTQSAVSRAIRTLEARVGAGLFERTRGQLQLTPAGAVLQEQVRLALAVIRSAIERVGQSSSRGVLVVRIPRAMASYWFLRKVGDFTRRFPEIDVQVSLSSRVASPEDLRMTDEQFCSGCDLAIRLLPRSSAEGRLERLLMEYVFPCCTSAVAGKGGGAIRTFADLGQRPLIEFEDGLEPLEANWEVWTKLAGLPPARPKQWVRIPDWHTVFDAAVQGIGVCLGRTPQVNDHLRQGTLVAPIPEALVSTRAHYLIRSPNSDANPKIRHFLEWLTSEADQESRFETSFLNGKRLIDPLALERSARHDVKAKPRRARRA
jgi:LysR family transcriptional regulator, glycine cleavage system transcriptional activator